ncbi:glycosyl hydrolase family 18 (putative chitinase) [Murinocardiopsis flavida]|uniref:Glycosyl hydrolase family 18 (Putative chitinase) n=1 Tax=Murinocardiopsis flavida TaxID=645275 RepID=A0A2P8DSK2_9ACTN|nr:chitinase [Murinocardiopsis flavida]PSL00190.1 glycosyl hydrolase family 18 (putative chitinase) [Murinocardiopsis flavida]
MRKRIISALAALAVAPAAIWAAGTITPAPADTARVDTATDVVVANESAADPASMGMAPYLYYGWGNPPDAAQLMQDTGVQWFTLSFILSDGGCSPAWDGTRPLDGADAQRIEEIRAAGGDVIPSIGGWSGNKLGEACADAESLAGAYQKVIDAYELKGIDIDIESTEVENPATQDKVLSAVKIVKQNNPDLKVFMTLGTTADGPTADGKRLISKAAETDAGVDNWTIMPFNFGGGDMAADTRKASEGLNAHIASSFGISSEEAYTRQGISSMNGKTDQGETITPADFTAMRDFAQTNQMTRFTFWSVNRDRPCPGGGAPTDSCSGVDQQEWEFSTIVGGFGG